MTDRCVPLEASPVGRENWSVQVSAPFLAEAMKAQLALVREHAERLQSRLDRIEEAQQQANWWRAALAHWMPFGRSWRDAIALYREAKEAKEKTTLGAKWIRFLGAMPKDAKVHLDVDDFTFFFPGDSFADWRKLWSRES